MSKKRDPRDERAMAELDEEPLVVEWRYYKYEFETNGKRVHLQLSDGEGINIAIPIGKKMAKRLSKDLKKASKMML